MVERLGPEEQERLREAGRVAAEVLAELGRSVAPGLSTADLDAMAQDAIAARGACSSQFGHQGFTGHVCTSRNDVVCHGVPSSQEILQPGDLINIDVTVEVDGFHGDTCRTFPVLDGSTPLANNPRRLLRAVDEALAAAIAVVRDGARVGDIGAAVIAVARRHEVSVVREYCGHGIGRAMHMDPQIPHVGVAGRGPRLRSGMAFTIEPMLNLGSAECTLDSDGWTVRTVDGHWSAQSEHTVLVHDTHCEIVTA
ncbi:MAG: type I methionyl aminopeptidase [Myxococcota bacterium]